ncbi:DUF1800 domain-containing protein [Agaribacter marinus]|uniref:DUF1800 domain-containing protein n=1 Tax=Agaribacter marinus TaxID=1431249 RepID=A0AA37SYT2_9ALTE|nr:DUF1800 domain-containing protein [Agaribacter marinus]GLR70545.1 hypothetical protein GCM10007852_14530 [Agaribacter marinus]
MPVNFAYIAMHRFSYGADSASLASLSQLGQLEQVQGWLIQQLSRYTISTDADWTSQSAIAAFIKYRGLRTNAKNDEKLLENAKSARRHNFNLARHLAEDIVRNAITTQQSLQARLSDFFANHFSVSRGNPLVTMLAPTLEPEAIHPNLHRKFSDLLLAVVKHPAMLVYLNNEYSIGPNSQFAKKSRKGRGLNENLAREILELHTLGVDAGYTQNDVIELAKAITGWSVGRGRKKEPLGFLYRVGAHEPGSRQVFGNHYPQDNIKLPVQGESILKNLANHPSTATHICEKLARHFVSDTPDEQIVKSMVATWRSTSGDIPKVMETLIMHPESWHGRFDKFKAPREFLISAYRSFGEIPKWPGIFRSLEILGQGINNAGSPAGYPDTAQEWSGASALMGRVEWANHFSKQLIRNKMPSADAHAKNILGSRLSEKTLTHLRRAESMQQAYALMLMSPEFQRR